MKLQYYVWWDGAKSKQGYPCPDVHTAEFLVHFLYSKFEIRSVFMKGVIEIPPRSTEGDADG